MQRVKKRSFQKFGNRMLPGGDLHEQEEKFFDGLMHSDTSITDKAMDVSQYA